MLRGLLLWFLLTSAVFSAPLLDGLPEPMVTLDGGPAPREELLKQIARQSGYHLLIGQGLSGQSTLQGRLSLGEALRIILPYGWRVSIEQGYLIIDQPENPANAAILAIASLEKSAQIRKEILLERASAGRIMTLMRPKYPRLKFQPHPTMNGFYVIGPRGDVASLKEQIPALDL